ncbi:hypothetical protein N7450_001772 [Penicillium hetheringtonii]|uniref:Uncharacterized protein n=1 Tax=Penicillium hetheringtonii TaxID=911720 RepID=A0AAD6H3U6_9EURO|nr:hypothetical protein N7450_001772 [Penicillium hetheringtonii]
MAIAAQEQVNELLHDDVPDNGHMLSISIYVGEDTSTHEEKLFGTHERAFFYQGQPDYSSIISTELSGQTIEKSSSIRDDQGQMLLMTSTHGFVGDHLRGIVREHLHQRLNMIDLEYHP